MANQVVVELVTRLDKAERDIEKFRAQTEKNLGFLRLSAANFVGSFTSNLATGALSAISSGISSATGFMKESIVAAAESEAAMNKLNTALAQTGHFSQEASDSLKEYAEAMQAKTTVDDDAVISNLALLESLTKLDVEGLKKAQTAAIDLSAALGIDLNTATEMVAKAANGQVSSFQRMGIEIQKGATDAQTFANTLQALSQFQGSAEAQAKTYDGAMKQLSNVMGDFQENLGAVVTDNPAVIEAISGISLAFQAMSKWVVENKVFLMELVRDGIIFTMEAITFMAEGILTSVQIMVGAWAGFNIAIDLTKIGIGFIIEKFGQLLALMGISSETITQFGADMVASSDAAWAADTAAADGRIENIQRLKDSMNEFKDEQVKNMEEIEMSDTKRANTGIKNSNNITKETKKDLTLMESFQKKFTDAYIQAEKDKATAAMGTLAQISTLMQSENIKLFRLGQAAAIANAIVNTALGITQALGAFPPPVSFIMAALVGAAGAVQIQKIASQKPPSQSSAKDGIDFIPEDKMTWVASRGERVVGARLNEDLTSFLDERRTNSNIGAPVNNITINVSGVIGEFDDSSRAMLAREVISAIEYQNVPKRGVI